MSSSTNTTPRSKSSQPYTLDDSLNRSMRLSRIPVRINLGRSGFESDTPTTDPKRGSPFFGLPPIDPKSKSRSRNKLKEPSKSPKSPLFPPPPVQFTTATPQADPEDVASKLEMEEDEDQKPSRISTPSSSSRLRTETRTLEKYPSWKPPPPHLPIITDNNETIPPRSRRKFKKACRIQNTASSSTGSRTKLWTAPPPTPPRSSRVPLSPFPMSTNNVVDPSALKVRFSENKKQSDFLKPLFIRLGRAPNEPMPVIVIPEIPPRIDRKKLFKEKMAEREKIFKNNEIDTEEETKSLGRPRRKDKRLKKKGVIDVDNGSQDLVASGVLGKGFENRLCSEDVHEQSMLDEAGPEYFSDGGSNQSIEDLCPSYIDSESTTLDEEDYRSHAYDADVSS